MNDFEDEAGFTLVELLVSLVLLSLMAIYALNALSSLKDVNKVLDRVGSQMEVDTVARHFRLSLADIRPVFISGENSVQKFLFDGSAKELEFVGSANGDRETGGLYFLRYSVDTDHALLVERQMLNGNIVRAANKTVLLREVESIEFKYVTRQANENVLEILDSWQQQDHLPTAIDVRVTFKSKDQRKWPTVVVAIKTAR
jgi:prepilin-type N-terminal cleavage/methylation domain-containing protein